MAITAVAVRKSTPWRGVTESWTNVYHYFSAANLDTTMSTDLVNQIVAAEKLIHIADVTFEDARVWEVGGTPQENETIVIVDVSGTGSMATSGSWYRELAIVARCDTNRNTSTGRRIYLRKYYHTMGANVFTAGNDKGTVALASGTKTPVQTCLETLREVTVTGGITVQLCAPGGQQVSDTRPVTVDNWLRVRQFTR